MEDLVDATFVINLDRSADRMRDMAEQCDRLCIPFTRVPAVDGRRVSRKTLDRVATTMCKYTCTPSMVGCALSHMRVWQAVVRAGHERVLVLEDDAVLQPNFVEGLRDALRDVPADWDVLLLGCSMLCDKKRRYSWDQKVTRAFMKKGDLRDDPRTWGTVFVPEFFAGTHCYVVSAKGARTLRRLLPKVNDHIDMAMNHPKLALYAVSPDLAYQRDMAASTIASFNFPKTLTPMLHTFRFKNGTAGYTMSAATMQVAGLEINAWFKLFVFLGALRGLAAPYVAGVLLVEAALGSDLRAPLVAYALGWVLAAAGARALRAVRV